jgi:hypothetical protein
MGKDPRTYIKLHDGMPENHKVVGLSDAAFRLYIEALCWCGRNRSDGKIPDAALRRLGSAKAQREIDTAGLIHAREHGGWEVHDYLEHQRSKAEIEAGLEQRRSAGRNGGLAKSKRTAKENASESLSETASKHVADTDTDTEELDKTSSSRMSRKRATPPPDIYPINDEMRSWASENTPLVKLRRETAKMLDWARGKAREESRLAGDVAFQLDAATLRRSPQQSTPAELAL